MLKRLALAASLLLAASVPAHAALELGDLVCETTSTTGTGTVNLGGAVTNYVTFVSQIVSGNTVPYHITSGDGKLETGIGTFTDGAPDTLSRTADWSTDGSGAELTLSGTSTVCLGPISSIFTGQPDVAVQVITADGTYTPTAGMRQAYVIATGAGGGGGGSDTDGSGGAAGGGGEAGGTAIKLYTAAEIGANAAVDIGAGGPGGLAASGTAGTDGDDTTFNPAGTGATITGAGGDGGDGENATTDSNQAPGGAGEGTATNGDINIPGGDGASGTTGIEAVGIPMAVGGMGGGAYWGGGGRGGNNASAAGDLAGQNGDAYGGGGGGGASSDSGTGAAGGDGAAGVVYVVEYFGETGTANASDARLKDIIGPTGDVASLLDRIKIYDFSWNADVGGNRKGIRSVGPLAQELFHINPDWVNVGGENPVDSPWTWKPERLIPYLIADAQNIHKKLDRIPTCYGIKIGNACIGVSM